MTVASFFRKYSVGCILNYVRLIITREISCMYTERPEMWWQVFRLVPQDDTFLQKSFLCMATPLSKLR
jgi:hypothetical protein